MAIPGRALLASAARTATTTAPTQVNPGAAGLMLFLNVSANPGGAETLQISVRAIDSISNLARVLATFPVTAAAANATYVYILSPGAAETIAAANVELQALPLPERYDVVVTHSAGGSWTYSLSASYVP